MNATLYLTLNGPTEYGSFKYSISLSFVPSIGLTLEIAGIDFTVKDVVYHLSDGTLSIPMERIKVASHQEYEELRSSLLKSGWKG